MTSGRRERFARLLCECSAKNIRDHAGIKTSWKKAEKLNLLQILRQIIIFSRHIFARFVAGDTTKWRNLFVRFIQAQNGTTPEYALRNALWPARVLRVPGHLMQENQVGLSGCGFAAKYCGNTIRKNNGSNRLKLRRRSARTWHNLCWNNLY